MRVSWKTNTNEQSGRRARRDRTMTPAFLIFAILPATLSAMMLLGNQLLGKFSKEIPCAKQVASCESSHRACTMRDADLSGFGEVHMDSDLLLAQDLNQVCDRPACSGAAPRVRLCLGVLSERRRKVAIRLA